MSEYDVIVVGAGNAALAAANSARENGAERIVVLEKAPEKDRGGNTHYSGGLLRIAFDDSRDLEPLVPDVESKLENFFDNVEPYFARVCDQLGISCELPRLNTSKVRAASDELSVEMVDTLKKFYERDYDLYNRLEDYNERRLARFKRRK